MQYLNELNLSQSWNWKTYVIICQVEKHEQEWTYDFVSFLSFEFLDNLLSVMSWSSAKLICK